jgi:hypothetical protein
LGIDLDGELGAAHGDGRGRAVHAIGVGFAAEVVDLDAHHAERDLEELAECGGGAEILERDQALRGDDDDAAVGEVDDDTAAAAGIDAVAGRKDITGRERERRGTGGSESGLTGDADRAGDDGGGLSGREGGEEEQEHCGAGPPPACPPLRDADVVGAAAGRGRPARTRGSAPQTHR